MKLVKSQADQPPACRCPGQVTCLIVPVLSLQLQDKATVLTTERKKVSPARGGRGKVAQGEGSWPPRREQWSSLVNITASLGGLFSFSQRGKTVPEELVKPEELSKYRQVASHVVSGVSLGGGREDGPGRVGQWGVLSHA